MGFDQACRDVVCRQIVSASGLMISAELRRGHHIREMKTSPSSGIPGPWGGRDGCAINTPLNSVTRISKDAA